jgi:hypothetical protein
MVLSERDWANKLAKESLGRMAKGMAYRVEDDLDEGDSLDEETGRYGMESGHGGMVEEKED